MQNGQKEEGLFIESRKGEGVMGKMPCLLPPLALGNRGGGGASSATALGWRSGPGAALGEGKWERETRGADSPF